MTTRKLTPVYYDPNDYSTHFEKLIKNAYGCIFIYNENVQGWKDKSNFVVGAGNAVIRPYRLDTGIRNLKSRGSWGIPTGYRWKTPEYHKSRKKKLVKYIRQSFSELKVYLEQHPKITTIYYSAGEDDKIGIEIFAKVLGTTIRKSVEEEFEKGFIMLEDMGFVRQ